MENHMAVYQDLKFVYGLLLCFPKSSIWKKECWVNRKLYNWEGDFTRREGAIGLRVSWVFLLQHGLLLIVTDYRLL